MDYFIDITVLPDPEFKATVLINALYAKCHRALGQLGKGDVGVSFPEHHENLGKVLRLHSTQNRLEQLMHKNWIKGLNDYTTTTAISPVPTIIHYRTVSRVQTKSAHSKRKRPVSKGWLSEAQANAKFPDSDKHKLTLPYAQLTSLSNQSIYRVYIKHGELQQHATKGLFNSYGLSQQATIPWF
ncbi:MAG: type I-F CRISPR-associated endoribonuclease Cas6/Csy4 [Pseudomonadota bacterium]